MDNTTTTIKDLNRPLFSLTTGEFLSLIENSSKQTVIEIAKPEESKKYAYGLKGLASLLGCSTVTASKLKGSGIFDKAITQVGRKIIIDTEKVLELNRLSKSKK